MNVVGFVGSPREGANTEILVNQILYGASQKGADTKMFNLNKLNIRGCQACFHCKIVGKCATDDDMQILYEEIRSADALVIGSPVYMYQMSAQTKLIIDRLFAFFDAEFRTRLNKKDLILAFVHGLPNWEFDETYVEQTKKPFVNLGFKIKGTVIAVGGEKKDEVNQQPEILAKAKALGESLVP